MVTIRKRVTAGLLLYSVALRSTSGTHVPSDKLANAIDVLASVGVSGLCHPRSSEFDPILPRCTFETLSQQEQLFEVGDEQDEDNEGLYDEEYEWIVMRNSLLAVACVMTSAVATGLSFGLMSLDPLNLLIKMRAGATEKEKRQAASLLPIVKKHHLLLVTFLLLNAMANEALPICLDKIVPAYVAVILSVTLVVLFGEIIPTAVFTGPNQLEIASQLVPLVKLIMTILFPVAYPIAKLLDCMLGDDESNSMFNRGELSALVRIQYEERLAAKKRKQLEIAGRTIDFSTPPNFLMDSSSPSTNHDVEAKWESNLDDYSVDGSQMSNIVSSLRSIASIHYDEVSMVEGALSMKTKVALDVYTPLRKLFAIPIDTILDERNVVRIYRSGFSRIPVYEPRVGKEKDITAIRGILRTKQLVVINANDERPVATVPLYIPSCVSPKMNLVDLINMFQAGGNTNKGGHMALVCVRPNVANAALVKGQPVPENAGLMGVITLEDVLEQLLQEQILDETDQVERGEARLAKWALAKWRLFVQQRQAQTKEVEHQQSQDPKMLNFVNQASRAADLPMDMPPMVTSPLLGRGRNRGGSGGGWSSTSSINSFFS